MVTYKQPAVFKKTDELIKKAELTKEKFATSLAKAKEDAEKLEQEVRELDNEAHEVYTLYLLDDLELSAFEDAKAEANSKRKLLSVVQKKINDISAVEKEELASIYKQYEGLSKEFQEERQKAQAEINRRLLEAKQKFMQEVVDISNQQHGIFALEYQATNIAVDAGVKQFNYMEYIPPYFDSFSMEIGEGAESINIGNRELYWAYRQRTTKPTL
jgi:hypothetical protein